MQADTVLENLRILHLEPQAAERGLCSVGSEGEPMTPHWAKFGIGGPKACPHSEALPATSLHLLQ